MRTNKTTNDLLTTMAVGLVRETAAVTLKRLQQRQAELGLPTEPPQAFGDMSEWELRNNALALMTKLDGLTVPKLEPASVVVTTTGVKSVQVSADGAKYLVKGPGSERFGDVIVNVL